MKISNKVTNTDHYKYNFYSFPAARIAFEEILKQPILQNKEILLPAYVGQSPREGSGVFDPIRSTKANYDFYKMDSNLHIDISDLEVRIKQNPNAAILLIHYWGFFDPKYKEIKAIAKNYNCIVIEDFAHALFTFFKNPIVDFDFGFFSLHKMFAYTDGGVLISQKKLPNLVEYNSHFFEHNLFLISQKRIENYNNVLQRLQTVKNKHIKVLRPDLELSVPQTFPLLLSTNKLKDELYFKLNENGFGVTSLYYQLISEVDKSYVHEKNVSSCILNLPIHQDANKETLDAMITLILSICDKSEN